MSMVFCSWINTVFSKETWPGISHQATQLVTLFPMVSMWKISHMILCYNLLKQIPCQLKQATLVNAPCILWDRVKSAKS